MTWWNKPKPWFFFASIILPQMRYYSVWFNDILGNGHAPPMCHFSSVCLTQILVYNLCIPHQKRKLSVTYCHQPSWANSPQIWCPWNRLIAAHKQCRAPSNLPKFQAASTFASWSWPCTHINHHLNMRGLYVHNL